MQNLEIWAYFPGAELLNNVYATAPKTSMLALLKRVKKLPKNFVGQLSDYVPDFHVKNQLQPDIYMYSVCLHLTN